MPTWRNLRVATHVLELQRALTAVAASATPTMRQELTMVPQRNLTTTLGYEPTAQRSMIIGAQAWAVGPTLVT